MFRDAYIVGTTIKKTKDVTIIKIRMEITFSGNGEAVNWECIRRPSGCWGALFLDFGGGHTDICLVINC